LLIWGETLTWPPSGNLLIRSARRRGSVVHYPSKPYREWDQTNLAAISALPRMETIDYRVRLRLVFRPPDLRPYDLDNRAKAVQDVLVKAGVISDDNYKILNPVHLEGEPKVKGEPGRVIVELYTL